VGKVTLDTEICKMLIQKWFTRPDATEIKLVWYQAINSTYVGLSKNSGNLTIKKSFLL